MRDVLSTTGNLVSSGRKDTTLTTEREEDYLNRDGW